MYNYSTTTYYTTSAVDMEALGAVLMATSLVAAVIAILTIVGLWKVFTKAGKPG